MKNFILFIIFFLLIIGLQPKVYASKSEDNQLAQISTNVQNCYSTAFLAEAAIKAGKFDGVKSVNVLADVLKRSDELDYANSSQNSGNQSDISRAYAMFYLARQSGKVPSAKSIIEDNFVMKRPVCIALSKAKYYNLYKLMNNEISHLFSKYPSTVENKNMAERLADKHPGIKFILKNRYGSKNKIVDEKLLNAMLNCALSIETIRSSKYLTLCKKILGHNGSYLWDKTTYRAVMKNKASSFNKYELIKKGLKSTRKTENDICEWDFNNPETILFSIKNISSEAYLILSLWRLNIELSKKISETLPSLDSSSFTARAAAADRLVSDEKAIPFLRKNLKNNDAELRRFLVLRLADETNSPARKFLKELKGNR